MLRLGLKGPPQQALQINFFFRHPALCVMRKDWNPSFSDGILYLRIRLLPITKFYTLFLFASVSQSSTDSNV
uniref:Uncharacterized protein n=1 Tax=Caenorhabditis tropicalis TaxID=1561998 RepID=A0A1I7UAN8_9PELO